MSQSAYGDASAGLSLPRIYGISLFFCSVILKYNERNKKTRVRKYHIILYHTVHCASIINKGSKKQKGLPLLFSI